MGLGKGRGGNTWRKGEGGSALKEKGEEANCKGGGDIKVGGAQKWGKGCKKRGEKTGTSVMKGGLKGKEMGERN